MDKKQIIKNVKAYYGSLVKKRKNGDGCTCYCVESKQDQVGVEYSKEEKASVPREADLGLGCGNPLAFSRIRRGDVVLDLGSGAGFDAFLAANQVGDTGKVIGVDMTPEMVKKARENALRSGYRNVEFRLGYIEHLPVESGSVDLVISNCVINLSIDKEKAFREAFRVLKPGGQLVVSDIVSLKSMPTELKENPLAYSGCISGAEPLELYLEMIHSAGFKDVRQQALDVFDLDRVIPDSDFQILQKNFNLSDSQLKGLIGSLKVSARKP